MHAILPNVKGEPVTVFLRRTEDVCGSYEPVPKWRTSPPAWKYGGEGEGSVQTTAHAPHERLEQSHGSSVVVGGGWPRLRRAITVPKHAH
jgi:hypothetical protein